MSRILIRVLQICAICIFITSCGHNKNVVYKSREGHIIVDSFDETRKIYSSISYLSDTVSFDGPSIYYYPNGKMEKWFWYRYNENKEDSRYPIGGIYYDTSGLAISIGGSPIVRKGNDTKGNFVMELICPPLTSEHTRIKIIDSFKNKLIKLEEYEPVNTDSTAWVSFPNSKIIDGNKYTINYLLINSLGVAIDSYTLHMSTSIPPKK